MNDDEKNNLVRRVVLAVMNTHDASALWEHGRRDPHTFSQAVEHALSPALAKMKEYVEALDAAAAKIAELHAALVEVDEDIKRANASNMKWGDGLDISDAEYVLDTILAKYPAPVKA